MAHLIPENWRHAAANLRHDIHDAIDRWWHRHRHTAENGSNVPVRRAQAQLVEDGEGFGFSPFFTTMGPPINVEETDDDVIVTAELPGLEKDDFTVDMSGRQLRIRGEKKQSSETKERGYYYAESRYGAFARTMPLPCEVDADHANATYKHGVLRITLPKTPGTKSNRINVKVQGSN
ncbi:Hsp20/alpha crystallin family protein [Candidatus Entotheonella palauensis]|uniref:Hsp20/alpha crystallin family protein n=1 Tax=Candidatus Entotheonella palauensis TaxID=93172 RepID=UPI000B7E0CC5|nr:Hsp20/alpha crystallin family protein [Candidatus Entotheonella palauensis]